ncbi:Gfo/Idh/MocA family oxidoreductase [Chloroflexi bacterium TSY]|nr:Gfo/Idh/MocA family oxidoreductase [Chloroflexi bacterium TSY]
MTKPEAFKVVKETRPQKTYRAAVIGCGRMGSTIDDEHIGQPCYPWPWAHAPALIESRGVELVAAADSDPKKLTDFRRRWGTDRLYTDYRELVEKEKPDLVCVTTRPEPRAEIVLTLAQMKIPAIYATKPMCCSLQEADAMVEACKEHGTLLAIACHLNWYRYYTRARELITQGEIGRLRAMICHSPGSLSNLQSHTLALFRLFAGAPAKWVFGDMDDDEQATADFDLAGSGYIVYENGVRAFMNTHAERTRYPWTLEFVGVGGRIVTRFSHSQFELWSKHPETEELIQRQFPGPWHPRSSMVDAIEQICRCLDTGEEPLCPGEFGREALEIAIAMRESHRRGNVRVDLPIQDRSLKIEPPWR